MDLFGELQGRGVVQQVSDPGLSEYLSQNQVTVYAGFDPTSDSLHVGNLLALITLRRFQLAGHKPIAIVGGATGMIGDPSGKTQERQLLTREVLERNIEGITRVISRFLELTGPRAAVILNNLDWFEKISFVDFLRDVGKHFTVNYMIAKESVRARLEDRDHGISYTEFSYMLLQAFDFHFLNQRHGCSLQVGGSDQWGNITAGTELIRRVNAGKTEDATPAYGLVWPLVTKADGTKFGKTESGAVWLTADKTSPYEFYQFFIRTPDQEVMKLLRYFTFLTLDELRVLEDSLSAAPEKRLAQTALAREMTRLVHGEGELKKIELASSALFGTEINQLDSGSLIELFAGAPSTRKPREILATGVGLVDLLLECGLSGSKGEARKDIEGGGIYVNNVRATDIQAKIGFSTLIAEKCLVLRKGKKNYHLVLFE
jgi:tyrosyl-tRNA synthetase